MVMDANWLNSQNTLTKLGLMVMMTIFWILLLVIYILILKTLMNGSPRPMLGCIIVEMPWNINLLVDLQLNHLHIVQNNLPCTICVRCCVLSKNSFYIIGSLRMLIMNFKLISPIHGIFIQLHSLIQKKYNNQH